MSSIAAHPSEAQLEAERGQLLCWWKRQLSARCWLTQPPGPIIRIESNNGLGLGSQLRQLHDHLGYRAKGKLEVGGLCAGTIYRTNAFIQIDQNARNGTRKGSVHVEHTVPVRVLDRQLWKLRSARPFKRTELVEWLLRHSVTCAFSRPDASFLPGYTSHSHVFDRTEVEEFGRPFARYNHMSGHPVDVWNVWSGKRVDFNRFTFADHMATVHQILTYVGASQRMRRFLRDRDRLRLSPRKNPTPPGIPDQPWRYPDNRCSPETGSGA